MDAARANPLKTDASSTRPGGTPFVHEGVLYRPAQDLSETYGGRVVINRIVRLTPTEFQERPVAVVAPYAGSPYPDGLHTLSAAGDVTLLDGKRHVFVMSRFLRQVRAKSGRLLARRSTSGSGRVSGTA